MQEPERPIALLDHPIVLSALSAVALTRCADTLDQIRDVLRAAAGLPPPSSHDPASTIAHSINIILNSCILLCVAALIAGKHGDGRGAAYIPTHCAKRPGNVMKLALIVQAGISGIFFSALLAQQCADRNNSDKQPHLPHHQPFSSVVNRSHLSPRLPPATEAMTTS